MENRMSHFTLNNDILYSTASLSWMDLTLGQRLPPHRHYKWKPTKVSLSAFQRLLKTWECLSLRDKTWFLPSYYPKSDPCFKPQITCHHLLYQWPFQSFSKERMICRKGSSWLHLIITPTTHYSLILSIGNLHLFNDSPITTNLCFCNRRPPWLLCVSEWVSDPLVSVTPLSLHW